MEDAMYNNPCGAEPMGCSGCMDRAGLPHNEFVTETIAYIKDDNNWKKCINGCPDFSKWMEFCPICGE